MEFLKSMGGKVVAGVVALVVIVGAITWWSMDPGTRQQILSGTGKVIAWFGIVLLVPWATFFFVGWVGRFERNLAGALLVVGYTLAEVLLLLWLFDWSVGSPAGWVFVALGALLAGVYNLFTCDWIAEKVS